MKDYITFIPMKDYIAFIPIHKRDIPQKSTHTHKNIIGNKESISLLT